METHGTCKQDGGGWHQVACNLGNKWFFWNSFCRMSHFDQWCGMYCLYVLWKKLNFNYWNFNMPLLSQTVRNYCTFLIVHQKIPEFSAIFDFVAVTLLLINLIYTSKVSINTTVTVIIYKTVTKLITTVYWCIQLH